jgi:hypothetical protein
MLALKLFRESIEKERLKNTSMLSLLSGIELRRLGLRIRSSVLSAGEWRIVGSILLCSCKQENFFNLAGHLTV